MALPGKGTFSRLALRYGAGGMLARVTSSARLRALDLRDRLTGRGDPLVPPRRLNFVGNSDFVTTGDEFLEHFVELAGLRPSERVLDIGCGIGRMARPLARYLDASGSYDGFDINRAAIEWCRRHYRTHPNFRFEVADLRNQRYHPEGRHRADEYRFPYPDASFDVAVATSVFTHLLEGEANHTSPKWHASWCRAAACWRRSSCLTTTVGPRSQTAGRSCRFRSTGRSPRSIPIYQRTRWLTTAAGLKTRSIGTTSR